MIFEFSHGMAKVKSPDDIKIRMVRKTDSSKSGSADRSGKQKGRSGKKSVRKKMSPARKRHNRKKTMMLSGWFAVAIISVLPSQLFFFIRGSPLLRQVPKYREEIINMSLTFHITIPGV